MLTMDANVWWPRLYREVVGLAKNCQQCQVAGKNVKPMLWQKEIGQLPKCTENNQELATNFAGPSLIVANSKKFFLQ